jgi:predicted esterase
MKKSFSPLISILFIMSLFAGYNLFPADTNQGKDFITRVKSETGYLVMRKYGSTTPATMIIWLHGDVSDGGPANYHFKIAEKAADAYNSKNVLCVALVRPGYPDGDGNTSTGDNNNRTDSYTKENISEVIKAIENLNERFKPVRTVVVGHSGGAATAAVIIGMKPELLQGALLVSCPCDLVKWREARRSRPWTRSENPSSYIEKISPSTKVIAITGSKDDNTSPELAKNYIKALKSRGIDASFIEPDGKSHNSTFTSIEAIDAIDKLLK